MLVSLVVCYIVLPAARSCAAWDDNNKDNVCTPTIIPAGLKRPPPSKTISPITWFGTILNTLTERIPRRPTGRSSVFEPGTLGDRVYICIGWRIRRSKAEELRLPPSSEEFESTAEERSVTTQRRAGVTRSGAGATRRERHRDRRCGRRAQEWKQRREGLEAPPGK